MNIHCPHCENACSEAAAACPKCGQPLSRTVSNRMLFVKDIAVYVVLIGIGLSCTDIVIVADDPTTRIVAAVYAGAFIVCLAIKK